MSQRETVLAFRDAVVAMLLAVPVDGKWNTESDRMHVTAEWALERANNIAVVFQDELTQALIEAARGEVVTGTIESRYGFEDPSPETMAEHAARVIK